MNDARQASDAIAVRDLAGSAGPEQLAAQVHLDVTLCAPAALDDLQLTQRLADFYCSVDEHLLLARRLLLSIEHQTELNANYLPPFDALSALAEFAYRPASLCEGLAVQTEVRELLSAKLPLCPPAQRAAIYETLLWAIEHELRQPEGTTPHALVQEAVDLALMDRSHEGCALLSKLICVDCENPNYYRVLRAALQSQVSVEHSHPLPFPAPELEDLRQELMTAKRKMALASAPAATYRLDDADVYSFRKALASALLRPTASAIRHGLPETSKWILQLASSDASDHDSSNSDPRTAHAQLIDRVLACIPEG